MTALHWTAQHGHREVAELLLRCGADVHCLSKFKKTAFGIPMETSNTQRMLLLQKVTESLEQLEKQLQEATLKARESHQQQQILQKEQEAEQHGLQLEEVSQYRVMVPLLQI